ncbi:MULTISPECIES: non-ribosomal peptide synthetase [Alteromonas]|jgi:amino acid adenylation domain-containing protein|uniref:Non-ribosomal peptide synthetase n=1 Tax=Alteromonas stellipolaris TaxID=233316 RepID=A0AAW7Z5E0_9ALTE|nr:MULTISPECIES: non-ribosomal peptide synthetase [Alteromonas]AMJ89212.1 non-ribosomal peptide synthetase [Alteromonas sp. Mac2]ALM92269.1 Long-chain-fatty-acid-CoA ligase [Alteromonas stellipolaris LMG 21856]AMJ72933.1 non-ribosomal peptide synthetase [Alteromonas stellipolaris]AMJ85325.1 non-ribosomal peptide synthetase [Alteromonas sp. Mac1]ANB20418.1 non-ribosomal peptide synthetase [Alteromonas stellipolaris]
MNAENIINICLEQEIYLSVDNGNLQVDTNKDALSEDTLALLKAQKQELVRYIQAFQAQQTALTRQQLKKVTHDGPIPLSFAQQRLWIVDRMEEGAAQSNVSAPFLLHGKLNKHAMQKAVNTIIARHEVLHSVYREKNNACFQEPLTQFDSTIPLIDLSQLTDDEFDQKVRELAKVEALTAFDLANDLMLRVTLLKHAEDKHVALFSMHHIASDGWSVGIFIKELNQLYSAFCQGLENPLPELEVQYSDYAHWQREWMQGSVYEEELDYWLNTLDGAPPVHDIPLDKPRTAKPSIVGKKINRTLSSSTLKKLNDLCRSEGVTLFMALQTLYALTVSKFSNEDDIVMGTPVAGRMHQNAEPLIGFFLNNLVLRSNVSGNPTLTELLANNKKTILDAFEHQNLPFDALVEAINPERTNSHQALFQLWFVLQNHESTDFALPELSMTLQDCNEFIHFDLSLEAIEKDGQLELGWLYQSDIFEQQTIEQIATAFETLIESALKNPESKINRLEFVSKQSNQPWLTYVESDNTNDRSLISMIEQRSKLNPEATALMYEGKMLSYGQLDEKSNQLANYLIMNGVEPNSSVGLCLPRSQELLIAMLGIMKAGAAYIPLDPNTPAQRLDYILNETQASALVAFSDTNMSGEDAQVFVVNMEHEGWRTASHAQPGIQISRNDLAYILFTSGSTGRPKGVAVSHGSVTNLANAMQEILADRGLVGSYNWAWNAPTVFDASVQALTQLAFGVELHMLTEEMRRDPKALATYISEAEIDILDTTPSLAELLVRECVEMGGDLPSMLIGGEAISAELWQQLANYYGQRDTFALNVYGPTECTVNSSFADITPSSTPNIGSGLPNVRLFVMDKSGEVLPAGAKGELYIGGQGVAQGYVNNSALTKDKFINSDQWGRLYKTGDLARYDSNGQLDFLGRVDFQVKLRGYRIELEEIESVALEHPGVQEAVVLVKDEQLVAFLVSDVMHENHILSFLESRLPKYMLPSKVVMLSEVPVTSNGKRDRKALLTLDVEIEPVTYVAPETELEANIQAIWQELLGLENISVDANFFEIGGHSLLGIRLASACREKLDVELPLKVLMEGPTIRALAQQCEFYEKQRQVLAATSQTFASADAERIVI